MSDPSRRRAFLRGQFSAARAVLRPPWAVAAEIFPATCTRCGDCLSACPSKVLLVGDGGYPEISFALGECTFCGECVAACAPRALQRQAGQPPWGLKLHIGEGCLARRQVDCRVCAEVCPVIGVIRFRAQIGGAPLPEVNPDECTGCGACVAPCPVTAITLAALPLPAPGGA